MNITVTEAAQKEVINLMESQKTPVKGVRIKADAISPIQANFRLALVAEGQEEPEDEVLSFEGFDLFVDQESVPYAEDITVDFVDGLTGRGFKIDNPKKVPAHLRGTAAEKIQTIIDDKINPSVSSHGGHVTLMDFRDGKAFLQFGGGCKGCGMIDVTLKQGVEVILKEECPEVVEVCDITDHTGGDDPYYRATT